MHILYLVMHLILMVAKILGSFMSQAAVRVNNRTLRVHTRQIKHQKLQKSSFLILFGR